MPLNKLDNFIKNTEGRILYVSPADLDSTDSITNSGNSLARPFKTIQRALIESARFSFVAGGNNDDTEKTTILLMPGEHIIDNRPGFQIQQNGLNATYKSSENTITTTDLDLSIESNFDLNQRDNLLYKFNSVYGGVIVPRGTSIVGLDLRKTKIRPTYVPNPTDSTKLSTSIFRITGACYFWQFSIFDGDELGSVYVDSGNFSIKSKPLFSHHKLTVFEYADGINAVTDESDLTDLDMYYAKLNRAYNSNSSRPIGEVNSDKFPSKLDEFAKKRPEYEIVGSFATDPLAISSIYSGNSPTDPNPSTIVTVTTTVDHNLDVGTPIKIRNVSELEYNVSAKVVETNVDGDTKKFKYNISSGFRNTLLANPTLATGGAATVTVETDTVSGASPYIFNISMRSVWGMQGMHADGNKATGFRSMVVAQFTGVSLQKDDRAFVKYIPSSRGYSSPQYTGVVNGDTIAAQSSATESDKVYHLDPEAIYRPGWETSHIKSSNDAILQIVSVFAIGYNNHFKNESGGDASITNSNSNFGQLSLVSTGFKKEAFVKDNNAFITHVIPPRAITTSEEDVDWLRLDITNSTATELYIDGFKNESVKPPSLTQGFRVGAKTNDVLYFDVGETSYSKSIIMPNGSSSQLSFDATIASGYKLTLSSDNTSLSQGEKVIILSDDGDLPENIDESSYYYVMKQDYTDSNNNQIAIASNEIQLASSKTDADNNIPVTIYGGTNLKVISRVCDKNSGDIGHPIQYNSNNGWYISVSSTGTDFTSETGISEPSYIKRITDSRSLDEKIYKVRVVVPKELSNSKNPEAGFVLQDSSSTGFLNNIQLTTLSRDDGSNVYNYKKNLSIITSCSADTPNQKAIVTTASPHKLKVGDIVFIKNVKSSSNTTGEYEKQYNGRKVVVSLGDASGNFKDKIFQYTYTGSDTFTVPTQIDENLPRFEKNDTESNLYIYRNEVVQDYVSGQRDGIYHLYVLNSNVASYATEFSKFKYSQNVVDLYPQLDRDNIDDNPRSSKSFGLRSPLGKVVTNDLKKSITKESIDKTLVSFGAALNVDSVSSGSGEDTITFEKDHGFNGLFKITVNNNANSGFTDGNYYGVKLLDSTGTTWKGATANITISGGQISSAEIVDGGSNYTDTDSPLIPSGINNSGSGSCQLTFTAADIRSDIGKIIQFDGQSTVGGTHRIIKQIVSSTQIKVHKYTNDVAVNSGHYGITLGSVVAFTATSYSSGISTVTTTDPHGLSEGNSFQVVDTTTNHGSFIVDSIDGSTTFEVKSDIGTSGQLLKLGLSSNEGTSDKSDENLASRSITFFDYSDGKITIDESVTPNVGTLSNITKEELPLGSYIQVDEEIMRVGGFDTNNIKLIRAVFGTRKKTHVSNSLVRKIRPIPVEFRRPSIIRASGHTFEYLGYGPGNYSTGLPQVQTRTLTEREEFLSQSQERSGGIVVYTGMNNKGDFFIGNQKKSSATGEEVTFDTPVPTITGQDPSRLSGIFDEITIKERLVVEGGDSKQILSQFEGPVTLNGDVRTKASTNVVGNLTIADSSTVIVHSNVSFNNDLNVADDKKLIFGADNDLEIYHDQNDSYISDKGTGNLKIQSNGLGIDVGGNSGEVKLYHDADVKLTTTGTGVTIGGALEVTGDITAFWTSDYRLKDNINPIENPLSKVLNLSGNTFDWNDKLDKSGHDVGVIAQEVLEVLPEAVVERDNGYLAVDYHKIIPLLVESIKELSGKVNDLEQKLEDK